MAQKTVYTEILSTGITGDVVSAPGHNLQVGDKVRVTDSSGTLSEGDYALTQATEIINANQFRLTGVGTASTLVGMASVTIVKVSSIANSLGKKIKLGFDKTPAPVTKQFQQLVDIEGTLLFDDAGNPLVTEESAALTSLTISQNALSIQVNNKNVPGGGGPIKIEEQFKETSEVSSSLLGVPRAEQQLSLFSDVATYGLDVDNWDASDFDQGHNNDPEEWYKKEHPVHGRRSNIRFYEGSDEQALYLKAFPSQYTFPYGTRYNKLAAPTPRFIKYMNFIALGRYLYDFWYSDGKIDFAEANFIAPRFVQLVNSSGSLFGSIDATQYSFNKNSTQLTFTNSAEFHDVDYLGDQQDSYDAVERWTVFYDKVRGGTDTYPDITDQQRINLEGQDRANRIATRGYKGFREYDLIQNMIRDEDAIPGAGSNTSYYGILQSKRTFRYQPGRASGFTFGVRMASDGAPASSTVAEWGCSNDTDEYMFQLRGEALSIVRRSTVQLPSTWFAREGIPESAQTVVSPQGVRNNQDASQLFQTKIIREQFNGDALQGGGNSGYTLSFEDVTMYKIEFSWYGAIGAKFYAYVPIGNDECRWVLMHTFVIENALGEPVLENPDFRMKYLLHTSNTKEIRSPIYLYKYGSSVYVDGGDEGTIKLSSETVDSKSFTTRTPILGIMPKEYILNSEGVPKVNFKKIYPSTITVTSNKNTRIDFEEVKGSAQGHHFAYAASLYMNGRHPKSRKMTFKYASAASKIGIVPLSSITNSTVFTSQAGNRILGSNKFKATLTNGSSEVVIVTDDNNFQHTFTGLQVGDTVNFTNVVGTFYVKNFLDGSTISYSSTGKIKLNLTTAFTGSTITTTMDAVHTFSNSEILSHLVADGVYGTYIGDLGGQIKKRGRSTSGQTSYALINGTGTNSRTKNGSIISVNDDGLVFDGFLSGYRTIVASKVPLSTNKFKIHFLNPNAKDPGIESGYDHFAEFSIGVTPYKPVETADRPDSDPELKFLNGSVYEEYDINEFPSIEYCHSDVTFDHKSELEGREFDPLYGNRLNVDPRLSKDENILDGANRGDVSTVQGEVTVSEHTYLSIATQEVDGFLRTKINFPVSFTPPPGITPNVSELGRNFSGTGVKFVSDFIEDTVNENIGYFVYVEYDQTVNSQLLVANPKTIQTKNLILKDDWQAYSVDENGVEKYQHKRFNVIKSVSFDTQPLYPVFALGDHARINGIVIEEIFEQGTIRTHTPDFALEAHNSHPISVVTSGNETRRENGVDVTYTFSAAEGGITSSFNAGERLSASRYDKSIVNQLRPGNCVYSTYVGENETVSLQLDNIFARDRKSISRGSLNNRAMFITATSLDGLSGTVQLSVTNKEQ
jgi:hypothetical protein